MPTSRCPLWSNRERTQFEQMSSGLPLKADITPPAHFVQRQNVLRVAHSDTQLRLGTGYDLAGTINKFGLG
jgi:hypothetical protein